MNAREPAVCQDVDISFPVRGTFITKKEKKKRQHINELQILTVHVLHHDVQQKPTHVHESSNCRYNSFNFDGFFKVFYKRKLWRDL